MSAYARAVALVRFYVHVCTISSDMMMLNLGVVLALI
jgi:hypothetical protein